MQFIAPRFVSSGDPSAASRIGTFDISSIPDQDCCQLFVLKDPETKAELAEVKEAEAHYDAKEMVRLGVENAAEEEFGFP